jgi:FkbM family methyltransferase
MKRILHLIPHLSTGGCPQFAYDLLRKTQDTTDAYVVEYAFIAWDYVVQRNRIIDLMKDRFFSLGEQKEQLFDIIDTIKPDVIHIQEFPEYFMDDEIAHKLYDKNREYVIVETSHDSGFNPANKRFFSDHLALISQWQIDKFKDYDIPITLLESDIEYKTKTQNQREEGLLKLGLDPKKKHVLNVGLWTSRKNQAEVLEYAKELERYPDIEFHFVGNQAPNFEHYWGPLIHNLPSNVQVWGERSDVNSFYECMDLFLFTSRGTNGDMETSPLVLREATGHQMPILMYNLPVYLNYYDKFPNIKYLTEFKTNINKILTSLNMQEQPESKLFRIQYVKDENKIFVYYNAENSIDVSISVADIDSKHAIYAFDGAFQDYSSVWCVPIPVETLEKVNILGVLRGYEITFWNRQRNTVIEKHIIWYNQNNKKYNNIVFEANPWNCTFFNYNEMFNEKNYEKTNVVVGKVCLDIGANDGIFTEWLLSQGVEKIYAIECDPRCIKFLNKKFNSYKNVTVINKALWKENQSEMKLYYNDESSVFSSLKEEGNCKGKNYYDVCSWDFTTLISKHNINKIDLFKIDIEGAEYEVFESMTNEQINKITSFLIEIHLNTNGQIYKISDRLKILGFEIQFTEHYNHKLLIDESEWKNYEWGYLTATKK